VIVNLRLPDGASIKATAALSKHLETRLDADPDMSSYAEQMIAVMRRNPDVRGLDTLADIEVPAAGGQSVPLSQLAKIEPIMEEGLMWRWDRQTCVTIQAEVAPMHRDPR
jgi:multidrug efflux pump